MKKNKFKYNFADYINYNAFYEVRYDKEGKGIRSLVRIPTNEYSSDQGWITGLVNKKAGEVVEDSDYDEYSGRTFRWKNFITTKSMWFYEVKNALNGPVVLVAPEDIIDDIQYIAYEPEAMPLGLPWEKVKYEHEELSKAAKLMPRDSKGRFTPLRYCWKDCTSLYPPKISSPEVPYCRCFAKYLDDTDNGVLRCPKCFSDFDHPSQIDKQINAIKLNQNLTTSLRLLSADDIAIQLTEALICHLARDPFRLRDLLMQIKSYPPKIEGGEVKIAVTTYDSNGQPATDYYQVFKAVTLMKNIPEIWGNQFKYTKQEMLIKDGGSNYRAIELQADYIRSKREKLGVITNENFSTYKDSCEAIENSADYQDFMANEILA